MLERVRECVRRQKIIPEISSQRFPGNISLRTFFSKNSLASALVACSLAHGLSSAISIVKSVRPPDKPPISSRELSGVSVCVVSSLAHCTDLAWSEANSFQDHVTQTGLLTWLSSNRGSWGHLPRVTTAFITGMTQPEPPSPCKGNLRPGLGGGVSIRPIYGCKSTETAPHLGSLKDTVSNAQVSGSETQNET